jgi:hypothetical protein
VYDDFPVIYLNDYTNVITAAEIIIPDFYENNSDEDRNEVLREDYLNGDSIAVKLTLKYDNKYLGRDILCTNFQIEDSVATSKMIVLDIVSTT